MLFFGRSSFHVNIRDKKARIGTNADKIPDIFTRPCPEFSSYLDKRRLALCHGQLVTPICETNMIVYPRFNLCRSLFLEWLMNQR